jgi:hypothetical protein
LERKFGGSLFSAAEKNDVVKFMMVSLLPMSGFTCAFVVLFPSVLEEEGDVGAEQRVSRPLQRGSLHPPGAQPCLILSARSSTGQMVLVSLSCLLVLALVNLLIVCP